MNRFFLILRVGWSVLRSLRTTTLLLLMMLVLVFAGTLFQVDAGLYAAQERFFLSWTLLLGGFLPFPGGKLVFLVTFLNLVVALPGRLRFAWRNTGLWLSHLGLLLLIVGGALGHWLSQEGRIVLGEGDAAAFAEQERSWEFAVWKDSAGWRDVWARDVNGWKAGDVYLMGSMGRLTVERFCHNALVAPAAGTMHCLERGDAESGSWDIPGVRLQMHAQSGVTTDLLLSGRDMRPVSLADGAVALLRPTRILLPFAIRLREFQRDVHQGTSVPRSFRSVVEVASGDDVSVRRVEISMNRPLRLAGWTIYQAGYEDIPGRPQKTILMAVNNPAGWVPLAGTVLAGLGLLLHFGLRFLRSLRARHMAVFPLLLFAMLPVKTHADMEPQDLSSLPAVLHNGRVKPFDAFARAVLLQIGGKVSPDHRDPSVQLLRILQQPDSAANDPLFLVEDPEVSEALGIVYKKRMSWNELQPGRFALQRMVAQIGQRRDHLLSVEKHMLHLSENMGLFDNLTRALGYLRPNEDFAVRDSLLAFRLGMDPDGKARPFLDCYRRLDRVAPWLDSLFRAPSGSLVWNSSDSAAWKFSRNLYQWSEFERGSLLRMIPMDPGPGQGEVRWISPWEALADGVRKNSRLDSALGELAPWPMIGSMQHTTLSAKQQLRLAVEGQYLRFDPFYRAEVAYGLALLLLLFTFFGKERLWTRACWVLLAAGFLLHTVGLVMRIYLSGRPPVTNLHESLLFVGWIAVVLGGSVGLRRRVDGLFAAALAGFALLHLAGRYASSGDSFQVLVAVLDSNFWLSTHVVTITLGYGGCLVAGLLGNLWLLRALRGTPREELAKATSQLLGVLGFGLLFSLVGTLLGGIWADQSWGRFWGWDPKENGALMIVLWGAAVFHARPAGWIGPVGTAVAVALGNVVVVFAWFGVNLLGVGLHSYGFSDGALYGVIGFSVGQAALAGVLGFLVHKRRFQQSA